MIHINPFIPLVISILIFIGYIIIAQYFKATYDTPDWKLMIIGFVFFVIFAVALFESAMDFNVRSFGKTTVHLKYNPGDKQVYFLSENGKHISFEDISEDDVVSKTDVFEVLKEDVNASFIIYYPKEYNTKMGFFRWKGYTEEEVHQIKNNLEGCYFRIKNDIILENKTTHNNVELKTNQE